MTRLLLATAIGRWRSDQRGARPRGGDAPRLHPQHDASGAVRAAVPRVPRRRVPALPAVPVPGGGARPSAVNVSTSRVLLNMLAYYLLPSACGLT